MWSSWHILMRMRAPKEGPCNPIAPLELPHSLHAFRRVSESDDLNMVIGFHSRRFLCPYVLVWLSFLNSYICVYIYIFCINTSNILLHGHANIGLLFRKATTHFVGDFGTTSAWVIVIFLDSDKVFKLLLWKVMWFF